MIISLFLSFIRFLIGLFSSLFFSFQREKLIDENKKYDLLDNIFKHLVNYEKQLFDAFDNDPKVYSIDVSIPKNHKEAWKIIKTTKTGVDYKSIEIFSIIDNNLEFLVFEKEVNKILKSTDSDSL